MNEMIPSLYSKAGHHQKTPVPKPPHGLGKCLPSITFPAFCTSFTSSTMKDCQALKNQTMIPVLGTNSLWTMQTGYSGITTPLIKKLVSTKAW
jgi:hypothetical protein